MPDALDVVVVDDEYTPTDPNPQPDDETVTFDGTLAVDVSATVWIRQNWADAWTLRDDIVATNVVWSAAPSIPTASLEYRYGPVLERGAATPTVRTKIELRGWYVRIHITCPDGVRKWHGFVDDVADTPAGIIPNLEYDEEEEENVIVPRPTGMLSISAVGMLAALDRAPLFTSYLRVTPSGLFVDSGYTGMRPCNSAPVFNPRMSVADESGHQRQRPNRWTTKLDVPDFRASGITNAFARQTHVLYWNGLYNQSTDGEYWTPRDIVEYLIAYHAPRNSSKKERIPIWLVNPTALPDWGKPELDCTGRTLFACLNAIMSQKNSLGYWAWIDEDSNRLYIEVFSTLDTTLTVEDRDPDPDLELLANDKQLDIVGITDPATSFTFQTNVSALANQVVCTGAKRVVVFTARINDGNTTSPLVDAWLADPDEQDFNEEWVVTDLQSLHERRDAMEEPKWQKLWRHFLIKSNWDWKYKVGETTTREDMFRTDVVPDPSGLFSVTNDRYLPNPANMRILDQLPLKTGIDYSVGGDEVRNLHAFSSAPFRDIEVYAKAHGWNFDGNTLSGKPCLWSHRGKRDVVYDINDPDYHLEVRPLTTDSGLGISINVVGAPQEILSINVENFRPTVRLPREQLRITMALEEDRVIEQHWPTNPPTVDAVQQKVFEFGDAFQLIEIVNGAIVGFDATDFKRTDSRYFIRDDRERLLQIAKELERWYSTERTIVRATSRRVTAKLWPGQLVRQVEPTTVHETDCNCVITEVSVSLPTSELGGNPRPMINIVTSRGELDPLQFVPTLRS